MTWLLTTILITAIFSVALVSKYKERNLELQQELIDKDKLHQAEILRISSLHNITVVDLQERIKRLNSEIWVEGRL